MKKYIENFSLTSFIIVFVGILLKRYIPVEFHYILGFFVGVIGNAIQFSHMVKNDRK